MVEVDPSLHRSSYKSSVCVVLLSRTNNHKGQRRRGDVRDDPALEEHECLAPGQARLAAQWIIVVAKTLMFCCHENAAH